MGLFGNKVFPKFGMSEEDDKRKIIEGAVQRLTIFLNSRPLTDEEKETQKQLISSLIIRVVETKYNIIKNFMTSFVKNRSTAIKAIQECAKDLFDESDDPESVYKTLTGQSAADLVLDFFSTGGKSVTNSITGNQVSVFDKVKSERDIFNQKVNHQCRVYRGNLIRLAASSFTYPDQRERAIAKITSRITETCANNDGMLLMGGSRSKKHNKKSPKNTYRSKYRATRPSPRLPANEYRGQVRRGNDGRMYVSKPDKNGRCAWRLKK